MIIQRYFSLMTKGLFVIFIATAFTSVQAARIKCWTNNEGIRECGNVVPPEYSQKGHQELSSQGIVKKTVERAKTGEELKEEIRLKELKKQEEIKAAKQGERDRVLLDTFSNEDEIIMTRDGKIAALATEIRITHAKIKRLQESFNALKKSAANMERQGKPVSDALKKKLENASQQIKRYTDFTANKEKEKETVRGQFAVDLERFRKLKSRKSISTGKSTSAN